MGITYGLLAALTWGISDVLVTQVARRVGVGHLLVSFEGAGLLTIAAVLLLRREPVSADIRSWALMAGLGLLNFVGAFLLYRSFRIGTLSLVAPIASANAIITGLLAFVAGERPALLPLLGALLLVAGVIVVTRAQYAGGESTLAGVPEALGVAVVFGFFYWGMNVVTPVLGVLWPILVLRLLRVLGGLLIWRREPRVAFAALPWRLVIIAALLSTVAFIAFNLGLETTYTAIVAGLASLASAVTVLLARLTLGERLPLGQWLGILVILLGVLLVSQ